MPSMKTLAIYAAVSLAVLIAAKKVPVLAKLTGNAA